jgi:DNA polymerase-3 subunit epsilon
VAGVQLSFSDVRNDAGDITGDITGDFPGDDIDLRDTTFVIVDLETTGGRSKAGPDGSFDAITEIGAVKVRGGEVIGEFATLVDPQRSIPPQIVDITGITTAMVRNAPTISAVLPMFLDFARGAVLVAHNAGFDVSFLRAAARRCGIDWPRPPVLCTVKLARRVLSREEAPSVRLSALARLVGSATEPTHRALDDARATVDVLHALIERVGNQGVTTYGDLRSYMPDVTSAQRTKRVLAQGLPRRPGVYLFRGPAAEVLYIGTASDLRRRVGQYFTGSDPRGRMKEMVALAAAVDHVECAHALEAGVRELRLLAAHAPPYNRRSRFPHRWWWLVLTDEPFPRFSAVRGPRQDQAIGPFRSRAEACDIADLIARLTGVRTCTTRIGRHGSHGPACPEREVSPCPADRGLDAERYAPAPRRAADLIDGTDNSPLSAAVGRVYELAAMARYESAARQRDLTMAAVEALWRGQRLRALAAVEELVAAAPDGRGGWQLAVVRHGRLAAAGCARRGVPPMPVVEALRSGAQVVLPQPAPLGGALVEETALLSRWLSQPGVRIVCATAGFASPLHSAGPWLEWAATARSALYAAAEFISARRSEVSELLGESHPPVQHPSGGSGVDGLRGADQTVLPGRQPFGMAG